MNNSSNIDEVILNSDEIDHLWNRINNAPFHGFHSWISLANFIFAVLGSISNFMSVIVLLKLSHQLSTFIYLTSLSISDMITCLTIMIIEIVEYFLQTRRTRMITKFFRQTEIFCGALAAASRVLSLWISTAVTMDRWILICYPMYGKMFCTLKRARIVSRTLFFIALIYSIPLCFEYEIIEILNVNPRIEWNNQTKMMESMLITKGYSDLAKRRFYRWFYMFFNAIFVYIFPTMAILFFNIQLIRALHRLKTRMRQFQRRSSSKKTYHQSKYSITIMVIAMVIALVLCRSPTIVLWILWSFELTIKTFFDSSLSLFVRRFHHTANLIAIINAATNFIPFCVFGQLFRANCLTTYCCRKPTSEQLAQEARWRYKEKYRHLKKNSKLKMKNFDQPLTQSDHCFLKTGPSFYSDSTSGILPSLFDRVDTTNIFRLSDPPRESNELSQQRNISSDIVPSLHATTIL